MKLGVCGTMFSAGRESIADSISAAPEAAEHHQLFGALWKWGTEHFSQRRGSQTGLGAQTSSALYVSRAQNRRLW